MDIPLLGCLRSHLCHIFRVLDGTVSWGLGIGFASTIAPLYLAEVSPSEKRGSIVTLNQIAIVSGILLAYTTNWVLAGTGSDAWRWMFGSAAIPAISFVICLHFVPETPRWLLQQNRIADADAALSAIGGATSSSDRLEEIRIVIRAELPHPDDCTASAARCYLPLPLPHCSR